MGNKVKSILKTSGFRRAAALVLVSGFLASCSYVPSIPFMGDEEEEVKAGLCPAPSILGNAERVSQFKQGPGRDLTDVMFQAEIGKLTMSCRYLQGRVVSDISFELIAERGPAARSRDGAHSTVPSA